MTKSRRVHMWTVSHISSIEEAMKYLLQVSLQSKSMCSESEWALTDKSHTQASHQNSLCMILVCETFTRQILFLSSNQQC